MSSEPIPIPTPDLYQYVVRKPVCRFFLNDRCNKGDRCRFLHPPFSSSYTQKEKIRKLGKCYCGASQMTLMNRGTNKRSVSDNIPLFFVVCSKTKRSMKNCM